MRLFLSSYRLAPNGEILRRLVGRPGLALMVFNACDVFGEDRLLNYPREADDLTAIGFRPEELDLRDHFSDPEGLRQRLSQARLVWVVGGNSFALARAMTAADFPAAARELVETDQLVYGGYSAGAVVATPTLEGIHLMDEPSLIPAGYPDVEPRPMGWVPWSIVPHWRSDHYETALADLAADYLDRLQMPTHKLRDGQAMVVIDDRTDIVGEPP